MPGAASRLARVVLGGFLLLTACGAERESVPSTTRTVEQVKPEVAKGLGDYRLVDMPEGAKRNLVEADPNAEPTREYFRALQPR